MSTKMNLPAVAIIGRPNVGKSTLFNRILGVRQAIMSREAGTTRDRIVEKVNWNDSEFLLIDTAGFLVDFYGLSEDDIDSQAQGQIKLAASEADLILFVFDAKAGVTAADLELGRILRKFNKKVIVVSNKADTLKIEQSLVSHELGFDEQINVSAISGRRSGDLLDLIVSRLPRSKISKASAGRRTRIAIVGRPNVGKSTLFNELIGADRSIVSATPGTTRDAIKSEFGDEFEIIDTAGFRRRGKIVPGIEKFSAFRTIRTISEADLVLVVVDAEEGLTRQDAHIVEMAQKMKKRTIIVLNKIDLLKDKSTEGVKNFYRYPFINKIPSVGISALKKENIDLLLKEIECTS